MSTDPTMSVPSSPLTATFEPVPIRPTVWGKLWRNPGVVIGGLMFLLITVMGLSAPWLGTMSPSEINPAFRNKLPGAEATYRLDDGTKATRIHHLGTDSLGRDVYSRVIYGARVSILVGLAVATISIVVGLLIGLIAGYIRWLDFVVMRIMDGLMAIPAILPVRHRLIC